MVIAGTSPKPLPMSLPRSGVAGSFIWSEVGSLNPSILGIPHSLSIIYPCYTRGEKQMNALDILFRSGSFNLSKVGEHFINPCCFGEDLAAWLRIKLVWIKQLKFSNLIRRTGAGNFR